MLSAKQEVMDLLKDLPDSSTLEEIQHCLYVRQKIQRGIEDIDEGRASSHEEVEKRMEKWLTR
jgi:predicted transcriptional regulator